MAEISKGRYLEDTRDRPFVWLMVRSVAWLVPAVTLLYFPGMYRWWMTAIYLPVTMMVFFPPYTLMLHCASHRPVFQKHVRWMNELVPFVFAPFFGQSPWTYGAHHIGMHHPENNLWKDRSTTLPFQRDNPIHFLRYFFRFFIIGLPELATYLWRNRRVRLVRRAVVGELGFWAVVVGLLFVNAPATLTVFVAPLVIARFAMMAGNWGQHAFVDRDAPACSYRNSITCINTAYNARCFNDGYHIGHHLLARLHWTELPVEFEKNQARYRQENAIVFSGIDFFGVWLLLMVQAHRSLARRMALRDDVSLEDRVALMRSRLKPIGPPVDEWSTPVGRSPHPELPAA